MSGLLLPDLGSLPAKDLLRLHAAALRELRKREIIRSENPPAGDLAEFIYAKAFEWELAARSVKSYDAKDSLGIKYQIKARRITEFNSSRQLSFLRKLDVPEFDKLAVLLFDDQYNVFEAAIAPIEVVKDRATYVAHVNGWRLIADARFMKDSRTLDVTSILQSVTF